MFVFLGFLFFIYFHKSKYSLVLSLVQTLNFEEGNRSLSEGVCPLVLSGRATKRKRQYEGLKGRVERWYQRPEESKFHSSFSYLFPHSDNNERTVGLSFGRRRLGPSRNTRASTQKSPRVTFENRHEEYGVRKKTDTEDGVCHRKSWSSEVYMRLNPQDNRRGH